MVFFLSRDLYGDIIGANLKRKRICDDKDK